MQSIWSREIQLPVQQALTKDIETEAAIIGGGLAGLLTAYYLQQQGISAVVLEANRIASGQTRNTTAKITCQHDLIYTRLIKEHGSSFARQYAQANLAAIDAYRTVIQQNNISCDWKEIPAYLYTCYFPEVLQQEVKAAKDAGISATFTKETSLPFPVKGAAKFEHQAQFHPFKFLAGILPDLTIYEHTSVHAVTGHTLHTRNGKVTAKHIIFACHYPFMNFPGFYFAKLHQERSYVLALKQAQELDGYYLGIDEDGCSFRNAGELLLLGGEGHRTGKNTAGNPYLNLLQKAQKWYPNSREVARWSAQDCIPIDGIPYIGRFSILKPYWYTATGFQKWGMTSSMVSAMLLSNMIAGKEVPYANIFSPQRFYWKASSKRLSDNIKQYTSSRWKEIFGRPALSLDELPNGHGGIVKHNGKKVGAYKDTDGKVYLVSIHCPHLGCELSWNPAEHTWDCPCHGSRFDYTGKRINNPAQEDISL